MTTTTKIFGALFVLILAGLLFVLMRIQGSLSDALGRRDTLIVTDTTHYVHEAKNQQPIIIIPPAPQAAQTIVMSDTAAIRKMLDDYFVTRVYKRSIDDTNLTGSITDTVRENKLTSSSFEYNLKPKKYVIPAQVLKPQILIGGRLEGKQLWATGTYRFKGGIEAELGITRIYGTTEYSYGVRVPIKNIFKPP
jgi:hypothetical protein